MPTHLGYFLSLQHERGGGSNKILMGQLPNRWTKEGNKRRQKAEVYSDSRISNGIIGFARVGGDRNYLREYVNGFYQVSKLMKKYGRTDIQTDGHMHTHR